MPGSVQKKGRSQPSGPAAADGYVGASHVCRGLPPQYSLNPSFCACGLGMCMPVLNPGRMP
jgi:hypothetical protein